MPCYLGIDFGTKFTGMAIYRHPQDPFPLGLTRLKSDAKNFFQDVVKIIREEEVNYIVLGVPLYVDGKANAMTKRVLQFKDDLIKSIEEQKTIINFFMEILEQDETLSTFEAEQRMEASPLYNYKIDINKIDVLCAQIILEDFLKNHPKSPLKSKI
jgi:putative Holliday junction resolvase